MKDILLKNEVVKKKIDNCVTLTNFRVIDYSYVNNKKSFKDISYKFLTSISFELVRFPIFLILMAFFLTLSIFLSGDDRIFFIFLTVIFGLLWFFVKKELIKFESPSDCIFACGSSEDLKIAKELYEKYNISHKNINSVDTSKDTENKKSNNLKKGENHDYI